MNADAWEDIEKEKIETTFCKRCGVKIWKYWLKKELKENYHKEMDLCAKCYFK